MAPVGDDGCSLQPLASKPARAHRRQPVTARTLVMASTRKNLLRNTFKVQLLEPTAETARGECHAKRDPWHAFRETGPLDFPISGAALELLSHFQYSSNSSFP